MLTFDELHMECTTFALLKDHVLIFYSFHLIFLFLNVVENEF